MLTRDHGNNQFPHGVAPLWISPQFDWTLGLVGSLACYEFKGRSHTQAQMGRMLLYSSNQAGSCCRTDFTSHVILNFAEDRKIDRH